MLTLQIRNRSCKMFLSITNVSLVIMALFKTVVGTEVTPAYQRWGLKHGEAKALSLRSPGQAEAEPSHVKFSFWGCLGEQVGEVQETEWTGEVEKGHAC